MSREVVLNTLQSQKEALLSIEKEISSDAFMEMIEKLSCFLDQGSRIMVCGVGKSGLIAQKISSTLSSVGCPSYVVHPIDALHGDLGKVVSSDVGIFISNSGSSEEIRQSYSYFKKKLSYDVAIVGKVPSFLADHCDYVLSFCVKEEGCPLNLAPMASTTVSLVLGDCIAAALMTQRKFDIHEYAQSHPSGSLGKKASLLAQDVMSPLEDIVCVHPQETIGVAFEMIPHKKSGSVCVCNLDNHLVGMMTDGDLRRTITDSPNCLEEQIQKYMTSMPYTVLCRDSLWYCVQMMKKYQIDELPVVNDNNCLQGLIDIQDALRAIS